MLIIDVGSAAVFLQTWVKVGQAKSPELSVAGLST